MGEGVIWESHPADAGYRALRLLVNLVPNFIAEMPDEAWERWAAVILDYPVSTSTEETGAHLELAAMAYRRAPERVVDTVLYLVDKENEKQGFLSTTRDLKKCWDDRLARALLGKAKEGRLRPTCLSSLLNDLLDYGLDEARKFAESLVVSGYGSSAEERARAVVAAQALVFHTADAGWPVVWWAMQEDDGFGGELVDAIARAAHHSNRPHERLSERQAADLYIWLMVRYPPSDYHIEYRDDSLTTIGLKESIALWRDDIPRDLQNRGTVEACQQIQRIASELPELEFLKWTLYQARAETRRQTWMAPELGHVLRLVNSQEARLVQNEDQLLDVVAESLRRLEAKLQGETPAAPDLWNKRDDGSFRPKDEESFSDYVKRYLQEDLERRGVVVNREVVIRRGEGEGKGERTDIRVDALVREPGTEEYGPVTVIIETKGNWYRQLYRRLETQLADRYLRDNRCRHGLYLVGWFNCSQWDEEDSRKKTAMRRKPDKVRQELEARALKISQQGLRVEPLLINAALR